MSNLSKTKREYLRLTNRFLKEVGLYDLWMQYIYKTSNRMSWTKKPDSILSPLDILGGTAFTSYIHEHRPNVCKKLNGYCMYEVFGEFLRKTNGDHYAYIEGSSNVLYINKDKKKVKIR